jgi:hypothetical protein
MQSVQFGPAADNVSVDLVDDGIVRIALKPRARMTAEDGSQARENLLALTGGKPSVVLLQITGVGSISREAVSFYSESTTVRAFAVLGSTPVDRVIGHGLLGLPRPYKCPTEFFTDTQEAMRWLRAQAKASPKA